MDGAVTTHNMSDVFCGSGLFERMPISFLAETGDLYLSDANHVALCQTQYPDVLSEFSWGDNGAYGNVRGDQSGWEAFVHGCYDYPWDCVLHYTGLAEGSGSDSSSGSPATMRASSRYGAPYRASRPPRSCFTSSTWIQARARSPWELSCSANLTTCNSIAPPISRKQSPPPCPRDDIRARTQSPHQPRRAYHPIYSSDQGRP